jgi:hypothetical protein
MVAIGLLAAADICRVIRRDGRLPAVFDDNSRVEQLPPIAPDDPRAPKYWMNETSGLLAHAVRLYLDRPGTLGSNVIALLRAYFVQWIDSQVWDMNPGIDDYGRRGLETLRAAARAIRTVEDCDRWLEAAVAVGIDPL